MKQPKTTIRKEENSKATPSAPEVEVLTVEDPLEVDFTNFYFRYAAEQLGSSGKPS